MSKCPKCGKISMYNWTPTCTARACQNPECLYVEERVITEKEPRK
jgi:hypothetical protein